MNPPSAQDMAGGEDSIGALMVPLRRLAVHASRDSAASPFLSKYSVGLQCSERRLPTEGGLPANKASADVRVVAKAVEGIALFSGIPKEDRVALFASMYTFDYAPGEPIMKQGEEGRNFYIVVTGAPIVTVSGGEKVVERVLGPGDTFGEVALLHGGVRSASVRAGTQPVQTWVLGRSTFRQTLSDAAFARRKKYANLLGAVKPLATLTPYSRSQLADAVVPLAYASGDVIMKQGSTEGARFHIIERGTVRVDVGGAFVATLSPGDYFGELCLLGNTAPTATVSAAEDGVRTIALDRAAFRRMLGEEVQEALSSHIKTYVFQEQPGFRGTAAPAPATMGATTFRRPGSAQLSSLAGKMAGLDIKPKIDFPKDLTRKALVALKELGVGMTGHVYLCKVPTATGHQVLAVVKIMSKVKMLRINQVVNVTKEKNVLAAWTCPQIISSLHTFQDRSNLYLVLEFMAGGDLFQHLCDVRRLSLGPARFYACEILLALGYIHGCDHVYRDLKPENILMDASGHVKLADMGFCKELKAGERTYTTCGTADYMAPEVMRCQGYNRSADYWAFGVLVYELLTGMAPFASKSDRERHAKILSAAILYPSDFNLHAKDLVARLCVVDISHRLGMMAAGIEEIQDHQFFADVDWRAMSEGTIKPPFVPRVRTQADWDTRLPMFLPAEKEETLHPEDEAAFLGY